MAILNLKINFIYGWGSLRSIKIFLEDILLSKVMAQGIYEFQIPDNAKKLTFTFGFINPYTTSLSIDKSNFKNNELFVGLYLNHRGLMYSLYDSLKKDYLRSTFLNKKTFKTFESDIYKQEFIVLKDNKPAKLTLILSVLIFVFSIVQQQNDWAPLAFLLSLTTIISSLIYINDKKVEKISLKTRAITTVFSFLLCAFFLNNDYIFLRYIIILFSTVILLNYYKIFKESENYKIA